MNTEGIIIVRTPFRISFLGGGTDFQDYFEQYGGVVLSTAINRYIYVTINSLKRFYEDRIRLSYSKLELVSRLDQLEHGIVKTVLQAHPHFNPDSFLDMHSFADFPASCGMGSSSAFCVGFLKALYAINGYHKTPEELAKEAIYTERVLLKEAGGWQDQIISSHGGFNAIHFQKNTFHIEPLVISLQRQRLLEESCLLFFTGGVRSSAQIQDSVLQSNPQDRHAQLGKLKQLTYEAIKTLNNNGDDRTMLSRFGHCLDEAWQLKKGLSSSISNTKIDEMYTQAKKAGALGGKLCGAGGEGFLLIIAFPEQHDRIKRALHLHQAVDLKFDYAGSAIVYNSNIR